ncbi:hypothetical protein DCAR_0626457 [Daucus carota subsp. sativus]|uniref:F-box domain-containing protein n=1 Tax=Daucus carota subsp. sativus TaxID=79200 RepID=A0A161ZZ51_DAUCS|nr:PREDICTED: F-box protein At5g49610-like [Daucus carota subsp. sativus]WOH07028.1 hypothetical protein DCAR_0626457 [Daucus carota subsp. sativus]
MGASFSEDILTEILKRLPVPSLIRLMLVQKSWYRLIQSPDFNKALSWYHQNNTPAYILFHTNYCNRPISLCVNDKQFNQYSSLPFPQDFKHAKVLGISNGLICLSHLSHNNPRPLRIFLWNPVIRKFKTSPRCPIPDPSSGGSFDATGLAFGYVHKMNDYKVINTVRPYDEIGRYISDKIVVLVYSLSTNSWKTSWKTVSKGMLPLSRNIDKPVIVNGVAYWNGTGGSIACFDIESEMMQEIMMPLKYRSLVNSITLVQNFSDLFLFGFDYVNGCPSFLDIWLLGDADVWTHKFRLDLENIEQDPVCFMSNHEIILKRCYPYGFKSYDIEKGEPTEIIDDLLDLCSALDIGPFTRGIGASPFVESLGLLGEESYT